MVTILTTVPSISSARQIAKHLLDKKMAACVSITGKAESHYIWKGRRERSQEYVCWIKTRRALNKKVYKAVKDRHPYECPEIITLDVKDADTSYLKWLYTVTAQ